MSEFGGIVTQNGVPVSRAADYQKVLDTRWRTLDVAIEKEVDFAQIVSDPVGDYALFEHKLGFTPAFQSHLISIGATTPSKYDGLGNGFEYPNLWADRRYIYYRITYFSGFGAPEAIAAKIFLRIYQYDPTIEFKAPVVQISPTTDQSYPTIGGKFLNEKRTGQGMRDEEISHYSLNTQAKAFGIHMSGIRTAVAPNYNLVVLHDLGYPPTFLTSQVDDTDASNRKIAQMGNLIGRVQADSFQVVMTGAQSVLGGPYAFLILKDPVEGAQ